MDGQLFASASRVSSDLPEHLREPVERCRAILSKPPSARSDSDAETLRHTIVRVFGVEFLQSLPPELVLILCRHLRYHRIRGGQVVFYQGQQARGFHVILRGALSVWVDSTGSVEAGLLDGSLAARLGASGESAQAASFLAAELRRSGQRVRERVEAALVLLDDHLGVTERVLLRARLRGAAHLRTLAKDLALLHDLEAALPPPPSTVAPAWTSGMFPHSARGLGGGAGSGSAGGSGRGYSSVMLMGPAAPPSPARRRGSMFGGSDAGVSATRRQSVIAAGLGVGMGVGAAGGGVDGGGARRRRLSIQVESPMAVAAVEAALTSPAFDRGSVGQARRGSMMLSPGTGPLSARRAASGVASEGGGGPLRRRSLAPGAAGGLTTGEEGALPRRSATMVAAAGGASGNNAGPGARRHRMGDRPLLEDVEEGNDASGEESEADDDGGRGRRPGVAAPGRRDAVRAHLGEYEAACVSARVAELREQYRGAQASLSGGAAVSDASSSLLGQQLRAAVVETSQWATGLLALATLAGLRAAHEKGRDPVGVHQPGLSGTVSVEAMERDLNDLAGGLDRVESALRVARAGLKESARLGQLLREGRRAQGSRGSRGGGGDDGGVASGGGLGDSEKGGGAGTSGEPRLAGAQLLSEVLDALSELRAGLVDLTQSIRAEHHSRSKRIADLRTKLSYSIMRLAATGGLGSMAASAKKPKPPPRRTPLRTPPRTPPRTSSRTGGGVSPEGEERGRHRSRPGSREGSDGIPFRRTPPAPEERARAGSGAEVPQVVGAGSQTRWTDFAQLTSLAMARADASKDRDAHGGEGVEASLVGEETLAQASGFDLAAVLPSDQLRASAMLLATAHRPLLGRQAVVSVYFVDAPAWAALVARGLAGRFSTCASASRSRPSSPVANAPARDAEQFWAGTGMHSVGCGGAFLVQCLELASGFAWLTFVHNDGALAAASRAPVLMRRTAPSLRRAGYSPVHASAVRGARMDSGSEGSGGSGSRTRSGSAGPGGASVSDSKLLSVEARVVAPILYCLSVRMEASPNTRVRIGGAASGAALGETGDAAETRRDLPTRLPLHVRRRVATETQIMCSVPDDVAASLPGAVWGSKRTAGGDAGNVDRDRGVNAKWGPRAGVGTGAEVRGAGGPIVVGEESKAGGGASSSASPPLPVHASSEELHPDSSTSAMRRVPVEQLRGCALEVDLAQFPCSSVSGESIKAEALVAARAVAEALDASIALARQKLSTAAHISSQVGGYLSRHEGQFVFGGVREAGERAIAVQSPTLSPASVQETPASTPATRGPSPLRLRTPTGDRRPDSPILPELGAPSAAPAAVPAAAARVGVTGCAPLDRRRRRRTGALAHVTGDGGTRDSNSPSSTMDTTGSPQQQGSLGAARGGHEANPGADGPAELDQVTLARDKAYLKREESRFRSLGKLVALVGPGSLVGELAMLMGGGRRTASVTTSCSHQVTELMTLDSTAYETSLHDYMARLLQRKLDFLSAIPLFAGWPPPKRQRLAYAMELRTFAHGATLFRCTDPVSVVYIIKSGAVQVSMPVTLDRGLELAAADAAGSAASGHGAPGAVRTGSHSTAESADLSVLAHHLRPRQHQARGNVGTGSVGAGAGMQQPPRPPASGTEPDALSPQYRLRLRRELEQVGKPHLLRRLQTAEPLVRRRRPQVFVSLGVLGPGEVVGAETVAGAHDSNISAGQAPSQEHRHAGSGPALAYAPVGEAHAHGTHAPLGVQVVAQGTVEAFAIPVDELLRLVKASGATARSLRADMARRTERHSAALARSLEFLAATYETAEATALRHHARADAPHPADESATADSAPAPLKQPLVGQLTRSELYGRSGGALVGPSRLFTSSSAHLALAFGSEASASPSVSASWTSVSRPAPTPAAVTPSNASAAALPGTAASAAATTNAVAPLASGAALGAVLGDHRAPSLLVPSSALSGLSATPSLPFLAGSASPAWQSTLSAERSSAAAATAGAAATVGAAGKTTAAAPMIMQQHGSTYMDGPKTASAATASTGEPAAAPCGAVRLVASTTPSHVALASASSVHALSTAESLSTVGRSLDHAVQAVTLAAGARRSSGPSLASHVHVHARHPAARSDDARTVACKAAALHAARVHGIHESSSGSRSPAQPAVGGSRDVQLFLVQRDVSAASHRQVGVTPQNITTLTEAVCAAEDRHAQDQRASWLGRRGHCIEVEAKASKASDEGKVPRPLHVHTHVRDSSPALASARVPRLRLPDRAPDATMSGRPAAAAAAGPPSARPRLQGHSSDISPPTHVAPRTAARVRRGSLRSTGAPRSDGAGGLLGGEGESGHREGSSDAAYHARFRARFQAVVARVKNGRDSEKVHERQQRSRPFAFELLADQAMSALLASKHLAGTSSCASPPQRPKLSSLTYQSTRQLHLAPADAATMTPDEIACARRAYWRQRRRASQGHTERDLFAARAHPLGTQRALDAGSESARSGSGSPRPILETGAPTQALGTLVNDRDGHAGTHSGPPLAAVSRHAHFLRALQRDNELLAQRFADRVPLFVGEGKLNRLPPGAMLRRPVASAISSAAVAVADPTPSSPLARTGALAVAGYRPTARGGASRSPHRSSQGALWAGSAAGTSTAQQLRAAARLALVASQHTDPDGILNVLYPGRAGRQQDQQCGNGRADRSHGVSVQAVRVRR